MGRSLSREELAAIHAKGGNSNKISEEVFNQSENDKRDTKMVVSKLAKAEHEKKNITGERIIDGIKISFKDHGYKEGYFNPEDEARNIYLVTVSYKGKTTQFTFGDSIHNTTEGKTPDSDRDDYINSILEAITSDYYYTKDQYPNYREFAQEFGYGDDSRSGEKTYKRCLAQGEKLHRLFSDKEIEQIRNDLENKT